MRAHTHTLIHIKTHTQRILYWGGGTSFGRLISNGFNIDACMILNICTVNLPGGKKKIKN